MDGRKPCQGLEASKGGEKWFQSTRRMRCIGVKYPRRAVRLVALGLSLPHSHTLFRLVRLFCLFRLVSFLSLMWS